MTAAGQSHEEELVRAFIRKEKQQRSIYLLSHRDRRQKFTDELAHFKWLDERFAQQVPASTARTVDELVSLLRKKGAVATVWVISEDLSIDGKEMQLGDAMKQTCGSGMGTFVSCIPGKLAYFSGEEMRSERLLERR